MILALFAALGLSLTQTMLHEHPPAAPNHDLPLLAPTTAGLDPIADNFDTALALARDGAVPKSAAPDTSGAFRFICRAGQIAWVDPLVNFGGKAAHLHQFFGNFDVIPTSTYASLRASGDSSCATTGKGISANRSAYWMPAMLDGRGNVVIPDFASVYYKSPPKSDLVVSDAKHSKYMGKAVDLPHGLNFIFGRDMLNLAAPSTGGFYYNCQGPTAKPGHYATMDEAAANCPVTVTGVNGALESNQLGVIGDAPQCWNGKELDTPDHRSHMAYPGYGSWGYLRCPKTHPYVIPHFTLGVWYTVDSNLGTWRLASDMDELRGSTFHADFMMAWSPAVKAVWNGNCVDKHLNCSGGELGDGRSIIGASGAPFHAEPRLVPVP